MAWSCNTPMSPSTRESGTEGFLGLFFVCEAFSERVNFRRKASGSSQLGSCRSTERHHKKKTKQRKANNKVEELE